jgi:hypothetical protein
MTIRAQLGAGLRRSASWRTLRRIQAEGPGRAFRRWRTWSEVLGTRPVQTDPPGYGPVEVHLLCHRGDYLCALWALKTLCATTGARWPVVVHLQGATTATMRRRFQYHFPNACLIEQGEADAVVNRALGDRHPRLREARRQSPFMMKLVDSVLCGRTDRLLILDSDVLFFRPPTELVAYVQGAPADTWLFQRDPTSTYNVTVEEAAAAFGIRMPDRVNSGVAVFRRSLLDIALCERLLQHPDVRRPSGWIEQTLFALCAGARGDVDFLPESYAISLERGLDYQRLVARHFAGPSRPLLTDEGMPYVASLGCIA